jgi:hypothetical protein
MKKLLQLSVTTLFFCFLLSNNNYSQILTTATVSGHVYAAGSNNDTTKTPVDSATVSLQSYVVVGGILEGDSVLYNSSTDSSGKFIISNVIPGKYLLMVTAAGYETLALREFDVDNDRDTDNVNLFLRDSLQIKGGIVSGNVMFENSGKPIDHAIIEFINVSQERANIFTVTDLAGHFSAKAPSGQYYISCTVITSGTLSFFQEFYPGVTSIANAEIVQVANGQVINSINFDVPEHVTMKHTVTFKGNVQSESNTSVPGAKVKIWASEEHDWDDEDLIATTKTDSLGNYSITLDSISQKKNTFIVSAYKTGYDIQFYNNKDAFYRANRLLAVNDTTFTGINFSLTPIDTVQKYSVSGTVMDSVDVGIQGAFVVLFDSATGDVRSSVTDSTGNYSIKGVVSGSYYLVFYASGYVPQFYLNANSWENATLIRVKASLTGINVTLKGIPQLTGNGEFIGSIHSDNSAALAGALVTVQTSDGETVGSALSDSNGIYTVTGLSQGSYEITVSLIQYTSQQQSVDYDPSFGSTTVSNFNMSNAVVTASKDPVNTLPARFTLNNNYPNPFNPSTIISFSLPINSQVHLEVYNILGQKVADLINRQMNAGNYSITFNADKLSSGVYLYRLETNNFTATKKMILAK